LNTKWNILNVYGTAHEDDREIFLTKLASFCAENKVPYIARSDFKILRFFAEKNQNFHPNRLSDTFNVVIHVNDLRELNISGGLFTWSNNHVDSILEKLDRILMSREWEIMFPTVHGHKEPRNMSDHNPLIIYTQSVDPRCRREFRFELT
jgi:hypothetical protein